MKTPHRIKLVRGKGVAKYNPETDTYESQAEQSETVPCFVNFIQKSKVFELYGNRSGRSRYKWAQVLNGTV